jgi:hypothetical protein
MGARLGSIARAAASALRDFVRGFVGATNVGRDAHGVRRALAQRAERRGGCC